MQAVVFYTQSLRTLRLCETLFKRVAPRLCEKIQRACGQQKSALLFRKALLNSSLKILSTGMH
ncbi:MAG: hypothetical protein JWP12_3075 [Bacteroidetes bacterium]|nr:hypothetical protein [Bacteroidota bacterium]